MSYHHIHDAIKWPASVRVHHTLGPLYTATDMVAVFMQGRSAGSLNPTENVSSLLNIAISGLHELRDILQTGGGK